MRRLPFGLMLIVAATVPLVEASLAVAEGPEMAAAIFWRDKVNDAWKNVRADRPLLLYVTLDGCGYCRKMENHTYTDPRVIEDITGRFVAARIDRQSDPKLVKQLGIRIYPTTFIINHESKVIDAISGYVSPEQLRTRLAKATTPKATRQASLSDR